jgi:low affinity Fe/Cu permease
VWRFVFIAFLIAHGGVHVAIWAPPTPKDKNAPFYPSHSWLLGNQKGSAVALALAAAALLVAAGIGLWGNAEWWRVVAVVGLAVSLGLMVVYFQPMVPVHRGGQRRADRRPDLARLAFNGDGRRVRRCGT